MGAGIPHRAGSPLDPRKPGMWDLQARAFSLRWSWGRGGSETGERGHCWRAEPQGDVDTDPEVEEAGRERGVTWRGGEAS